MLFRSVSGSLGQWREAVLNGLQSDYKPLFASIDSQIKALNLNRQLRIA